MSVKFTLLSISLFMSTLSLGMAAAAPAVTPVTQNTSSAVHHSDSWQPLIPIPVDKPAIAPAAATTAETQAGSASAAEDQTKSAKPGKPAAASQSQTNDAFINAAIKRNEVLSQLQYEKSVLTLEQDISQLKMNIKKNNAALNAPTPDSAPVAGKTNAADTVAVVTAPQLVEVLIKDNLAQAVIFYQDNTITVSTGQRFGDYTVKAIDKTSVTLLKDKQQTPLVLNIFRNNNL